jgi:hypothetical protein
MPSQGLPTTPLSGRLSMRFSEASVEPLAPAPARPDSPRYHSSSSDADSDSGCDVQLGNRDLSPLAAAPPTQVTPVLASKQKPQQQQQQQKVPVRHSPARQPVTPASATIASRRSAAAPALSPRRRALGPASPVAPSPSARPKRHVAAVPAAVTASVSQHQSYAAAVRLSKQATERAVYVLQSAVSPDALPMDVAPAGPVSEPVAPPSEAVPTEDHPQQTPQSGTSQISDPSSLVRF